MNNVFFLSCILLSVLSVIFFFAFLGLYFVKRRDWLFAHVLLIFDAGTGNERENGEEGRSQRGLVSLNIPDGIY